MQQILRKKCSSIGWVLYVQNPNQFATCFTFSLIRKNFLKYCVKNLPHKLQQFFKIFPTAHFAKLFALKTMWRFIIHQNYVGRNSEVCTFFKNSFSFIKMSLLNITHLDFENSVAKIYFTNRFFEFLGEKKIVFPNAPSGALAPGAK